MALMRIIVIWTSGLWLCNSKGFGDQEGHATLLQPVRKTSYELDLEKTNAALFAQISELKGASAASADPMKNASPVQIDSHAGASGNSRFKGALAVAKAAVEDLDSYYEHDEHILRDAVVKRGDPSEDVLIAKMAIAMVEDEGSFKIAAVGSSVTAGHDTFVDAAWPAVIERALKPTWEALGVDFLVRNQAVGGRNPNPWVSRPFLGCDPDCHALLHPSWNSSDVSL
jgi:hypothetical protein